MVETTAGAKGDILSIDGLNNLANSIPELSEHFQKLIQDMLKAHKSTIDFSEVTKGLSKDVLEEIKLFKDAGNSWKDAVALRDHLTKKMGGQIGVLSEITKRFGADSAGAFTKILYTAEPLLGLLPKMIPAFTELSKEGAKTGSSIGDSFTLLAPYITNSLGKSGEKISDFVSQTIQGADAANGLERSIVSMSASTGNLNSVFAGGVFSAEALDREYSSMTEHLFNVANATGHTMSETLNYANAMSVIPNALNTNIQVTEDLGNEMTQLEASLKLASAYGVAHGDVVSNLSKMYQNFGTRGTEAFESLNSIYKAAQDVGLPLKTVNDMVLDGANHFMLLGDNIKAATNVVKVFGEAFKNSNLGPEGIKKVVDSMIKGVEKMNEGTKAFISSQTGGPGGLAGGFQTDLAIQEGRMDEVLGKTMSAMQKQFGTAPVTLKEAGSNQAMAGEFYKQVSYLKDVAGIASSNQEAYRILEAMKTGATGDLQLGKREGKDELSSAIDRGAEMQSRSNTVLNRMSTTLEYQKMIQAKIQQSTAISTLGIGMIASRPYTMMGARTGGVGIAQGSGQSRSLDQQVQSSVDWVKDMGNMVGGIKSKGEEYINKAEGFVQNILGGKSPVSAIGPKSLQPAAPTTVIMKPTPLDINIKLDTGEVGKVIKRQVKAELKAQQGKNNNQALTGSNESDEVTM